MIGQTLMTIAGVFLIVAAQFTYIKGEARFPRSEWRPYLMLFVALLGVVIVFFNAPWWGGIFVVLCFGLSLIHYWNHPLRPPYHQWVECLHLEANLKHYTDREFEVVFKQILLAKLDSKGIAVDFSSPIVTNFVSLALSAYKALPTKVDFEFPTLGILYPKHDKVKEIEAQVRNHYLNLKDAEERERSAWGLLADFFVVIAARVPRQSLQTLQAPFSAPVIQYLPPLDVFMSYLVFLTPMFPDIKYLYTMIEIKEIKPKTTEELIAKLHWSVREFLRTPVPTLYPMSLRFEGTWIVAPQGRGKTNLLHQLVKADLPEVLEGKASVILLDSKGDLIRDVPRIDMIARSGKLCLIEPSLDNPLALNPLDLKGDRKSIHTVSLLEYIFGALLDVKMTPLQSTLFRGVLRTLVEVIPNPTMETFRDIISNGIEPYSQYIRRLDTDMQDFFYKEFPSKTYTETRQQILWRLRLLLDNPVIKQMFKSPTTKLDMAKEMDAGKVIVINNNINLLGEGGAEFFGRFFISLVLSAARARSHLRDDQKVPVYFYIDECHTVIARDENIAKIIDQCRSQKIGLILAHQRMKQIKSDDVLDALSNCAVRLANSDEDAAALAPRLRTTPEHLKSLPKGSFVTFARDITDSGVTVSVPFSPLSELPKISRDEWAVIEEQMRVRYCFTPYAESEAKVVSLRDDPNDAYPS